MSFILVCDVCEEQFDAKPSQVLRLRVPNKLIDGSAGSQELQICSWNCLANLSSSFLTEEDDETDTTEQKFNQMWDEAAEEEEEEKPVAPVRRIRRSSTAGEIFLGQSEASGPVEGGAGKFFPAGMTVDHRPPDDFRNR